MKNIILVSGFMLSSRARKSKIIEMAHLNGRLEENVFTLIPYGLQTVIDKPKQVCTDSSLVKEETQQNIKKGNLGLFGMSEETRMASIAKPRQSALNALPH